MTTTTHTEAASPLLLVRALRPHQWVKNVLLFVPLVTSHRIWPLDWVPQGLLALVSFSLVASGTYVVNDLLDREADRAHPAKRHRPFASGALSVRTGVVLAAAALVAGGLAAWPLGPRYAFVLGCYLGLTLAYSLWIKRVALLDVIVLAALYSLRVMAGHTVFAIPHSEWLLGFIVFLFLGLALVKRYAELLLLQDVNSDTAASARRGYTPRDLELVGYLGTSSSFLSVLVFALYITSEQVRELYRHPELLWLVTPVLLYWLARVWRVAHHGQMDADPVIYALRDPVSYGVGAVMIVLLVAATGLFG